jgi:hypothetical protein
VEEEEEENKEEEGQNVLFFNLGRPSLKIFLI